jgi:CO/xanthine dehydrogenase Mo-binding subunit/NADPH-dependent glutamate synthase beta subunit-like oxidoreductase/CO/xanthine dehydrogenase FAD-binding subunit
MSSQSFIPRDPHRYVGTYRPRVDGPDKASGRAEYLDDIALGIRQPGMLHAKVLRSPYPHARITSIDTSRAEALPGVHCVLTYDDPEVAALKPTTNAWTSMNTAGYRQMYWPSLRDRRVLSDHVTWAGDEAGAVVAAETEEIAEEALRLLEVEWEELPFALRPEDALEPGAPLIHPEINPCSNLFPVAEDTQEDIFYERGDVAAGFESADVILEVSSRHHRADHGCLDTRGCLVTWKGDKLTCWTNLYQADQTRMHIAEMLELPLNKVRVICPYVGGSFGRGNVGDQIFFIFTALLAKRTGRPVRFKHTRHEDFHDTRNAVDYDLRVGATRDGRITALSSHSLGESGGYAEHTHAAVKMVLELDALEVLLPQIPAVRLKGQTVYTNSIPGGCMRGIGNIQLNLALGLAVDALAEELGLDPIDVALRNFSHEWEPAPNKSLEAVLRAGAERIGWERRTAPGAAAQGGATKLRGIGFSFHHAWHAAWQEAARGRVQVGISLNPDGSVVLQAPQAETGVGSNTCAVLACAEALAFLGVTDADVEWIAAADTETGLKDMVQTDSSVSYLHAELMAKAAAEVKEQLVRAAAGLLEKPAADVDIAGGLILVAGEPSGSTVKDVLQSGDMLPLHVTVTDEMPMEKTGAPYLASFAEVEVDTETGMVEVTRLVVVHDAGTVMFPAGAEAQQIGAQVQSIGETLYEEVVYDRESGLPLSFDWIDYTMPTMLDMPVVEPVLLEVWRGAGEYGACGIGESAITCTPRAILNAVYNATGVHINEIPAKPEKVLDALARKAHDGPGVDEDLTVAIRKRLEAADALAAVAEDAPHAAAAPRPSGGRVAGGTARTAVRRGSVTPAPEHRSAESLEEAAARLKEADGTARAVAGGTDLVGLLKGRVRPDAPATLVDLKTIPGLDGVEERDGALTIGSLTRLSELERHPLVRERHGGLAQAAHAIASPQLRNMGTVGGNIAQEPRCWYYRAPDDAFDCTRKGGRYCNAFTGDSRHHSIAGSMKVETRPCTAACPGGVEIPEYMELMRAGDLDGAARRLLARNPMPAVTGRVCPHTCEDDCNRGLFDQAVSVREVERFLGDRVHADPTLLGTPAAASGRSVAVVGSGPAGLAAAHYLRLRGHAVTVFERAARPGGMLRYGIPDYRLPPETVDAVVEGLAGLGVEIRCGVDLGGDVKLDTLRRDHDAVFLATGAWALPRIGLEGEEELPAGLTFLSGIAEGERSAPGPRVLVIGGGSVAMDAAVSARRLGAEKVTVACLETCEEMPALLEEVEEALAEGIELAPSCGPARLLREEGRVVGMELVRCTSVFDEDACFAPRFDQADRTTVIADEVILAVGQRVETDVFAAEGLSMEGGHLKVDAGQLTSKAGVYAGGDVATGPATVIAAIGAGRRAAEAISASFEAERPLEVPAQDADSAGDRPAFQTFDPACAEHSPRCTATACAVEERTVSDEDACTLPETDAAREASRCFNCGCVAVTPSDLAPVLVALDALVVTTDRDLPAADLFAVGPGTSTVLDPGELVREVRLPAGLGERRTWYEKFRLRKTIDFPLVSVAVALDVSEGRVADARVVLGAAAPVPWRLHQVEAALLGLEAQAPVLESAARAAAEAWALGCAPLRANEYKVRIATALIVRAVARAASDD